MARINLLPWREELREERQKEFTLAMGATFLIAALLFYLALSYVNSLIDEQNQRNQTLQNEITQLDIKIKEIEDLDKQRNSLLARMNVIQELQESRPKIVKTFDALVRAVPDGVFLEKFLKTGDSLTFNGVAESNARVSLFMRKIDENPEFDESNLQVIKKTSEKNNAIRKFTVDVKEASTAAEEAQ